MKKFLWGIIPVIILACVAFFLGRGTQRTGGKPLRETITDTVRYVDTIKYHNPAPVFVKSNGTTKVSISVAHLKETLRNAMLDTLPRIRADTLEQIVLCEKDQDSVQIELPMLQSVYKDKDYTAYISGVNARLDSIFVYPKREVITIRKPPKHWHIGISSGYGTTVQGFKPYIGIGITYSLISF